MVLRYRPGIESPGMPANIYHFTQRSILIHYVIQRGMPDNGPDGEPQRNRPCPICDQPHRQGESGASYSLPTR